MKKKIRVNKIHLFSVLTLAILIMIFLLKFNDYFCYNMTNSMPKGIYLLKGKKNYQKGDIVLICPDLKNYVLNQGLERGYIDLNSSKECTTDKLIKIILAKENDLITINKNGMYLNDKLINLSVKKYDKKGRKMNIFYVTNYVLKKGEYFVYTPQEFSFDSRYFGLINEKDIIQKIDKFITF